MPFFSRYLVSKISNSHVYKTKGSIDDFDYNLCILCSERTTKIRAESNVVYNSSYGLVKNFTCSSLATTSRVWEFTIAVCRCTPEC